MALVFMSLLSSCVAAGGFAWQFGTLGWPCAVSCPVNSGTQCVNSMTDSAEFSKIDSGAAFLAAGKFCETYEGLAENFAPGITNGKCRYRSGIPDVFTPTPTLRSICDVSDPDTSRLCSCFCAAGTFSTTNLQKYPCPRYDTIPTDPTLPFHLRLRISANTSLPLSVCLFPQPRLRLLLCLTRQILLQLCRRQDLSLGTV